MIYVLSGSSGVGKTTIEKELKKKFHNLVRPRSYTTRQERNDRSDRDSYVYVTESDFINLIEDSRILEYTNYADNYYGTSKDEIDMLLQRGNDILLVLDIKGGYKIKEIYGNECKLIYILAPGKEELKKRLIKRGTDEMSVISKRLSLYEDELKNSANYDYFVTNDKIEKTVDEVAEIISKVSQ